MIKIRWRYNEVFKRLKVFMVPDTDGTFIPFIERKLFLKVNRDKTCVANISKVKYLGYSFYRAWIVEK